MSDSIERAKRQETLKGLILDLHAGKTVAEVKGAFADLIQDIGPEEISEMEQSLIAEGLPESQVKLMCDVHVEVFREGLEASAQIQPETIPGHPVHTFVAENEAVGAVLDALASALEALGANPDEETLSRARQGLAHLREFELHYLRKENILFPYLEKHNFSGPTAVMWAIHDDIRADWKSLDALLAAGPGEDPARFSARIEAIFPLLQTAIREMAYKEEHILFPTALGKLSHQEWVEIWRQEGELGHCYVEPGKGWLPTTVVQTEAGELTTLAPPTPPAVEGMLNLDTGLLTLQQVNLMLTHLPVEVTFVDENDQVRYYSESKELIFPRSPAIIGREVQNCHPPASVHKVQEILNDFRAGRRDAAEFWIHMGGSYIYIRYFALRDENGAYRGTMEVTQEISRIQELEGEKRLLSG